MLSEIEQRNAPGEDRTHNLRIAHTHTAYKYGALTDCATGATYYFSIAIKTNLN